MLGRVVLHAPAKEKPLKAKDFFILGLHKFCETLRTRAPADLPCAAPYKPLWRVSAPVRERVLRSACQEPVRGHPQEKKGERME